MLAGGIKAPVGIKIAGADLSALDRAACKEYRRATGSGNPLSSGDGRPAQKHVCVAIHITHCQATVHTMPFVQVPTRPLWTAGEYFQAWVRGAFELEHGTRLDA